MIPTKTDLIALCQQWLDQRQKGLDQAQTAVDESMEGAVKSSAGDKHNTERAHLQLQAEKLGQQYKALDAQRLILSRIDPDLNTGKVHLGSLVITDKQCYFIAIAAGQLQVKDQAIWAIAPQSPIGKLLLGKSEGDSFSWNQAPQTIVEII